MDEQNRKNWEELAGDLNSPNVSDTYKSDEDTSFFPDSPIITLSYNTRVIRKNETRRKAKAIDNTVDHQQALAEDQELADMDQLSLSNIKLLEEIGRGGMGIVYKGHQKSLQRHIALKKLSSISATKLAATKRAKFISEALVTAYLSHPNIVPIHELGINEHGELVLSMKMVEGMSWNRLLHPEKREEKELAEKCDFEKNLSILLRVCDAIAFAHSKGIVHNDLKPSNIIIGEFGEVMVMDWGIAIDILDNRIDDVRTIHKKDITRPMGTPSYMPPELAEGRGEDICVGTDIYLLGGILYEILMGKAPHTKDTVWLSVVAACKGAIPEFAANIPLELEKICTRALAKLSQNRYSSVRDFQDDIRQFLRHRESIIISKKADELLKDTIEGFTTCQQKSQRNQFYDRFAHVIANFVEARELWQDNPIAAKGELKARLAYAEAALKNDDLGLASAQALIIKEDQNQVKEIRQKISDAQVNKEQTRRLTKYLRVGFASALVLIIVAVVVGTLAYRKIDEIWKKLAHDAVRSTTQRTLRYFEPATPYMKLTRQLSKNNLVDINNPKAMFHYFLGAVKANPNFTWASIGREDGTYLAVYRTEDKQFFASSRTQTNDSEVQPTHFRKLQWTGQNWKEVETKIGNYDPRTRPWYRQGQKSPDGIWVKPFMFATIKKPGFMYVAPDKKTKGVWTVEYEISYLSKFLANLQVENSGRVYILTQDGIVVGHPKGEVTVDGVNMVHASKHPDPMLSGAWKQMLLSKEQTFSFGPYLGMVERFPEESGINWQVLVVVPSNEVFGRVHSDIKNALMILVAFIGFCGLLWVLVYLGIRLFSKAK